MFFLTSFSSLLHHLVVFLTQLIYNSLTFMFIIKVKPNQLSCSNLRLSYFVAIFSPFISLFLHFSFDNSTLKLNFYEIFKIVIFPMKMLMFFILWKEQKWKNSLFFNNKMLFSSWDWMSLILIINIKRFIILNLELQSELYSWVFTSSTCFFLLFSFHIFFLAIFSFFLSLFTYCFIFYLFCLAYFYVLISSSSTLILSRLSLNIIFQLEKLTLKFQWIQLNWMKSES